MTLVDNINDGFIALVNLIKSNGLDTSNRLDTSNNKVLLPRKIGASQRWYQSGLRHGAEYPYTYIASSGIFTSGTQHFTPFIALEDATITALEIQCSSAKANATVSLGIYESDSNNDIANPLFTSNPISCSTAGAKNAPCNVRIVEGKVYWLSSLSIGAPGLHRDTPDKLFSIKGSTSATTPTPFGYYTTGNTSMTQSVPTNKMDVSTLAPRVLFVVA